MAFMYNCATDWTFDIALEDAKKATALPMLRGVNRRCENDGVWLFTILKTAVKFAPKTNSPWDDSWQELIDWSWVSDVYKDIYGQRPHFSDWYWRGLLGVYQPIIDFKPEAVIMQEKADAARYNREVLLAE